MPTTNRPPTTLPEILPEIETLSTNGPSIAAARSTDSPCPQSPDAPRWERILDCVRSGLSRREAPAASAGPCRRSPTGPRSGVGYVQSFSLLD